MMLMKTLLFVTLMAAAMANHSCPDYWTVHGDHCYRYIEKKPWYDAKTYCQNLGGYLVSINNKDENDFVSWLVSNQHGSNQGEATWIGLGEYHHQDTKTWEDGTTVTYENFASGEPNNDGDEQCIETCHNSRGYWNDGPCGNSYRFVCESENPVSRMESKTEL